VLAGFGATLLGAGALEAARARLGRRGGAVLLFAAALAVLVASGRHLVANGLDEMPAFGVAGPIYDALAERARPSEVLLELPWLGPPRGNLDPDTLEADAMVGSTRHWLRLVGGFVGYVPAHRPLLERTVVRLPRPEALADLTDITHARWLLLHPASEWRAPAAREAILGLPGVEIELERDGWTLARLTRTTEHPEWYAAVARGWRPDRSPLGTPLAPLAPASARAEVTAHAAPERAGPGWMIPLVLDVRNAGTATWPAAVSAIGEWTFLSYNAMPDDAPNLVRLVTRWRVDGGEPTAARALLLPRDVLPGETVRVETTLPIPTQPGRWELEVQVEQVGSAAFAGNPPLRLPLALVQRGA